MGLFYSPSKFFNMGISRDSYHKKRATGGRRAPYRKKRKFDMGRPPAMTKLNPVKRIRQVRTRGGNIKHRALRLSDGNYSWGSESITRKTRILNVVYNATNNESVRTNTLVKNSIVQIDATPFRQWYEQYYGVEVSRKNQKQKEAEKAEGTEEKKRVLRRKHKQRQAFRKIDPKLEEQVAAGKFYACISSRPGQSGRADGYILEGPELDFYLKKMQ